MANKWWGWDLIPSNLAPGFTPWCPYKYNYSGVLGGFPPLSSSLPSLNKVSRICFTKHNFNPFHHCLPHWFPGWSHDGFLWSISKVKSRSPFPSCTTPTNPKTLLCRHYFPAAVSLLRSLLTMKCPSPMKSVHSSFKTQMSPPLHFFCLVCDHVTS